MNIKRLLKHLTIEDVEGKDAVIEGVRTRVKIFVEDISHWTKSNIRSETFVDTIESNPFFRWIIDPSTVKMVNSPNWANENDNNNNNNNSDVIPLQMNPLSIMNKIDSYLYKSRAMGGYFEESIYSTLSRVLTDHVLDVKNGGIGVHKTPINDYKNYKISISNLIDWLNGEQFESLYKTLVLDSNDSVSNAVTNTSIRREKTKQFVLVRTVVYLYYNRLFENMGIFDMRNYWTVFTDRERGTESTLRNIVPHKQNRITPHPPSSISSSISDLFDPTSTAPSTTTSSRTAFKPSYPPSAPNTIQTTTPVSTTITTTNTTDKKQPTTPNIQKTTPRTLIRRITADESDNEEEPEENEPDITAPVSPPSFVTSPEQSTTTNIPLDVYESPITTPSFKEIRMPTGVLTFTPYTQLNPEGADVEDETFPIPDNNSLVKYSVVRTPHGKIVKGIPLPTPPSSVNIGINENGETRATVVPNWVAVELEKFFLYLKQFKDEREEVEREYYSTIRPRNLAINEEQLQVPKERWLVLGEMITKLHATRTKKEDILRMIEDIVNRVILPFQLTDILLLIKETLSIIFNVSVDQQLTPEDLKKQLMNPYLWS